MALIYNDPDLVYTEIAGTLPLPAKMPIDPRAAVDTKADLTLATTWRNSRNKQIYYKGMVVSVINDPIPSNNGAYVLQGDIPTDANSWIQLNGGESDSNTRWNNYEL